MLGEIRSVAWSIIDPEFRNAFADWPNVSKVAERNAPDAGVDPGFRTFIFKRLKPFMIDVRFPYFDHVNVIVSYGILIVKGRYEVNYSWFAPILRPSFYISRMLANPIKVIARNGLCMAFSVKKIDNNLWLD
jgi:hypothetical protein